jgi:hypothetical protein
MRVVENSAFRIREDEPGIFKTSHDEFRKEIDSLYSQLGSPSLIEDEGFRFRNLASHL